MNVLSLLILTIRKFWFRYEKNGEITDLKIHENTDDENTMYFQIDDFGIFPMPKSMVLISLESEDSVLL